MKHKISAVITLILLWTVAPASKAQTLTFYRAINLGGDALTIAGNSWEANTDTTPHLTTNGSVLCNFFQVLTPTTDAETTEMIQCSRQHWAHEMIMDSMPAGTYQVYIWTWLNWDDPAPATYTFSLQGAVTYPDYASGPAGKWDRLGPFEVTVSDGTLTLTSSGGNANVSGLEVYYEGEIPTTPTPTPEASPTPTATPLPNEIIYTTGSYQGSLILSVTAGEAMVSAFLAMLLVGMLFQIGLTLLKWRRQQ